MVNIPKLRGAMAEKGFNQKQLAASLKWSERTMQLRLKSGKFGTDEAEKIGDILNIDRATLVEIFLPYKSL